MFELITNEARQWLTAMRDFDGTYTSVTANVNALQKLQAQSASWPAAMRQKQAELLEQGKSALSKLQALKTTRDKVVGWLKAIIPGSSQPLGFLPLIYVGVGIAAFATAVGVANHFLSGTASFAKQVSAYQAEQQRLVEQGVDPVKAAQIARKTAAGLADSADAPGLFEKLGSKAIYVGGAVVLLVWLGPKILEHLGARRR